MNYTLEIDVFFSFLNKAKQLFIPTKNNNYVPGIFHGNFLFYGLSIILALQILSVLSLSFPLTKSIFFANVNKLTLIDIVNKNRQDLGLGALTESEKLDQAALLKAQDMVAKNYFSHSSPQGTSPWFWFGQVGYTYSYAGENLAVGFLDSESLYDAWFNSPSHKANLLNPNFKEIGMAVVPGFGGNNAILVVQLFGNPVPVPVKTVGTVQKPTPAPSNTITPTASPAAPVAKTSPIPTLSPTPTPVQASPTINPNTVAQVTPIITVAPRQTVLSEFSIRPITGNVIPYSEFNRQMIFLLQRTEILQYIFYGIFVIFTFYFGFNMFMNVKNQNKAMIFKSLVILFMVLVAMTLNYQLTGITQVQII